MQIHTPCMKFGFVGQAVVPKDEAWEDGEVKGSMMMR
jgi:hypothetical protein